MEEKKIPEEGVHYKVKNREYLVAQGA